VMLARNQRASPCFCQLPRCVSAAIRCASLRKRTEPRSADTRSPRSRDCRSRELENEARALERQWSLKRERARYEAERARRQYDAVEPENRLVARSLERVWEDKLPQAEQTDIEYESWRRQQPISLAADRAQIISLGADLPKLWDAASVVERKQILRLVVKEVVLDQRPESGQVWIRIIWQTGAVSEHKGSRNRKGPQCGRPTVSSRSAVQRR
jgi:hypothetical protein